MKRVFFIYTKEERILSITREVFLKRGYKEKDLYDTLEDKDFVISLDEDILNAYKKIKDDKSYDVNFIAYDDSSNLEKYRIYHYRNHYTHYFDGYFLNDKEIKDLTNLIIDSKEQHKPLVLFESFGFKFSNPIDVDVIIDSRCLPNAYWKDELRCKCGLDKEVRDYVFSGEDANEYLEKTKEYVGYYLSNMEKKDRRMPVIGIACTGGQHRSIALCEYLAKAFSDKYLVFVKHREINRFLCRK